MSNVRMTTRRRDEFQDGGRSVAGVARRSRLRRGLATVEMALVITLLLWIVLGIVEYGWMLLKYQEVTGANRQGTRIGAPYNRTNQDVRNAINSSMAGSGLGDFAYTICIGTVDSPCTGSGDTVNLETLSPGDLFEVRLSIPYSGNEGVSLGMPLVPRPAALSSRLSMVREGI